MPAPTTLAYKLETGSIPEPNTGCFLWLGDINKDGYGGVRHRGRSLLAHRAAWEDKYGPPPAGKYVLHTCDQPCCINTNHLYIGTQSDNMRDAVRRGRNQNTKKTHCKRGHPLSGKNLYSYTNKGRPARCCYACHNSAAVARRAVARQGVE